MQVEYLPMQDTDALEIQEDTLRYKMNPQVPELDRDQYWVIPARGFLKCF